MNKELEQAVRDSSLFIDLHVHTKYCDGSGSPEEIVRAAIGRGLDVIGFSGHSHTVFDREACMSLEDTKLYEKAVRAAAGELGDTGQIRVFCGIEQDYYGSGDPFDAKARWDYIIGSVHYVEVEASEEMAERGWELTPVESNAEVYGSKDRPETLIPKFYAHPSVDDRPEFFERAINDFFGGDVYTFAETYYRVEADVVRKTGADIIGHFDLFAKFNAGGKYFDENHPRYVAAWKQAADALLETGAIFEINYGAVNKGYRNQPYPAAPIREYLAARGAAFISASDSHKPETLGCWRRDR